MGRLRAPILFCVFLVIGVVLAVIIQSVFAAERGSPPAPGSDAGKEQEYWRGRLKVAGPEKMREEFHALYGSIEDFKVQHTAAHFFGELWYEEFGLDGVRYCTDISNYGCYHGFMGLAASIAGDIHSVFPDIDKSCSKLSQPTKSNCYHGLGHGVLGSVGYDIDALREGLALCKTSINIPQRQSCYAGVFMEYNARFLLHAPDIYASNPRPLGDDPYEPCPVVDEEYQSECYFWQPDWWKGVYERDFAKIDSLCAGISSEEYRDRCYRGVGKSVVWFFPKKVARTRAVCAEMSGKAAQLSCLSQAAFATYGRTRDESFGRAVCEGLGDADAATCLATLETFLQ